MSPTMLAGRAPRTSHEIVLGTSTLRGLGLRVGQLVTVTVSGHRMRDRIVGRAVFPNFGQGSFTPTDLGEGAETTAAVLRPQAVPDRGLPATSSCCCVSPAARAGRRQSPGSSAR